MKGFNPSHSIKTFSASPPANVCFWPVWADWPSAENPEAGYDCYK